MKLHGFVRFFESEPSRYGFRVAVAMFCPAVVSFLAPTAIAFVKYRFLWIVFTALLGFNPVSGRVMSTLLYRIIGTIGGSVLAKLLVWLVGFVGLVGWLVGWLAG